MEPTPNARVAAGLAARSRLTGRLVLVVIVAAALALLGLSLASGMLAVEVVPPAQATIPPAAVPTTETPGQPSTGPATSKAPGGAAPSTGVSSPTRTAQRARAGRQRSPAPTSGGGPDARPGGPPAPSPQPGLVRVRVRPVGACVEVLAGVPPVRTCR